MTSPTGSNRLLDSPHEPEFKLQFLCSLIPKSFDGVPTEFNEFITNCDNAMNLAHPIQADALYVFILSRLTGNARAQIQGKEIEKWNDLKKVLSNFYQDKKHYIQLMEELNTLKQNSNENVLSFHERISKIQTRILNSLPTQGNQSKIETIKELSLSRFIYHSKPEISRFLRGQKIESFSEALNVAIEEERALQMSYSDYKRKLNNTFCNICKRSGHETKSCYRNRSNTNINYNNFRPQNADNSNQNSNSNQYQQMVCNYCKKSGHLIKDCRKREYNNRMRRNQGNNDNRQNVHLNYEDFQEPSTSSWE